MIGKSRPSSAKLNPKPGLAAGLISPGNSESAIGRLVYAQIRWCPKQSKVGAAEIAGNDLRSAVTPVSMAFHSLNGTCLCPEELTRSSSSIIKE